MALYDSVDCLSRLRTMIRQPSTSDVVTDAIGYEWLGQGQIDILTRLSLFAPLSNRGPVQQMTLRAARTVACGTTTGDQTVTSSALFLLSDIGSAITGSGIPTGSTIIAVNSTSSIEISAAATATASPTLTLTPDSLYPYTYTFGQDADGNALYPFGEVQLYLNLNDIPDWPMIEGVEYLMEGNVIRAPNNAPLTSAPYFQCLALPSTLSATQSPVLKPVQARELIVDAAAMRYAEAMGYDMAKYEARLEKDWARWIGPIQAQYARPGSIAASHPGANPARWNWMRGYNFRGIR